MADFGGVSSGVIRELFVLLHSATPQPSIVAELLGKVAFLQTISANFLEGGNATKAEFFRLFNENPTEFIFLKLG